MNVHQVLAKTVLLVLIQSIPIHVHAPMATLVSIVKVCFFFKFYLIILHENILHIE
jgi:hypothetical protein